MSHPQYLKDPWQTRDRVDTPLQPTCVQTIAKTHPNMSSGSPAVSPDRVPGCAALTPQDRKTATDAARPPARPGLRLSHAGLRSILTDG